MLRVKAQSSQLIKNPFVLVKMKDSSKNVISLDREATPIRVSIWKKLKKRVSSGRNKISLKY